MHNGSYGNGVETTPVMRLKQNVPRPRSSNTCYRYPVEKLSAFGICPERPDEGNDGGNMKLNTPLYLLLRIMSVVQCAINLLAPEFGI